MRKIPKAQSRGPRVGGLILGAVIAGCTATEVVGSEMADTLVSGPGFQVDRKLIELELDYLPPSRREKIVNNEAALRELIDDFYRREAVVAAVVSDELLESQRYAYRLERAKQEALFAIALDHQRNLVLERLPPLDELAEERYLADPDRYRVPPKMHLRHILLKAETTAEKAERRPEAERIRESIASGADFASLASERSQDQRSARQGGDLGWVSPDTLVRPFATAALALGGPGDLSDIVETQYGLHIIELLERQPGRTKTFEDVKDSLISELREELVSERLRQWYETVTDPEKMTAHQEVINDFVNQVVNDSP